MAINLPIISKFDNKGVKSALGAFDGLSKGLKTLGGLVAATFSVATVVNFGKTAVKEASDLSESINAVNKSYGEFSDEVLALGDDVASRLGLKTVDFNAATVRFSAFAEKVVGKGENVTGFVDDITTRAADFASVFNIDVSEALQVFQSGLAGEAEPLKRFGINLLQTEVAAYAVEAGIVKQGEAMTEAQKVQARYGLLMQETIKTAGDFADTSDGLANSQRILKATFGNLSAEVGTSLTPVIATFVATLVPLSQIVFPAIADFVEKRVTPALSNLADAFKNLVGRFQEGESVGDVLGSMFAGVTEWLTGGGLTTAFEKFAEIRQKLIDTILEALPGIVEGLTAMLPSVVEFILGTFIPQALEAFASLISELATMLNELMPTVIDAITNMVPDFINTLAALLPVIVTTLLAMVPTLLNTAVDLFVSLIDAVVKVAPDLIATIVELLPQLVTSILSMLPGILSGAIQLFTALVDALPIILPVLIKAILDLLPVMIDTLIDMLPELIDGAFQLFIGIVTGLQDMIPELLVAVLAMVPQIVTTLLGAIPQLVEVGFQLVAGLARGIVEAVPRVLANAVASVGNTLVNGVKNALQIKSPSRVFMGIGEDVVAGLTMGLDDGKGLIANASLDMADNLKVSSDDAFGGVTPMSIASKPSSTPMQSSGSSVMNITVNAGMGADGSDIGRKIVDEIIRYERSSGKVFARA